MTALTVDRRSVGLDPLRDLTHREARAARRYGYDSCPDCGGPKRTHSTRCRECWRVHPRRRHSELPASGRAVARDNFELAATCECCRTAPAVDRHHIDGDACNNVAENIASLCRRCHMEIDGRLRWRLGRKNSHCKHGHPLDGDNVYVNPKTGQRRCRTCQRRIDRKSRERRLAA